MQGADAAARHADAVKIQLAQLGRGGQLRGAELSLGARHQAPHDGDGTLDRHLLADDGAQHHLVFIPPPRQPHPGPSSLDAGEQRILPQVFADAAHVGVEIPHAAHAVQDVRQRTRRQIPHRESEPLPLDGLDADEPLLLADPVTAFVTVLIHPLQPRNGA